MVFIDLLKRWKEEYPDISIQMGCVAAICLPYGVSFFSILMLFSAVTGASVGADVVIGTTIAQSGPAKPRSQWHRFTFVHTYFNNDKSFCIILKAISFRYKTIWLTPCPKHSTLLPFVGHLVWSMYGNILTHDWFTHTKSFPHGEPSRTKPSSV